MKNVIQITDNILGMIVPSDCDILECEMWHEQDDYNQMYLQYPSDKYLGYQNYSGITLGIGNFKIHGTCTLPAFEFDFDLKRKLVNILINPDDLYKVPYVINNKGEKKYGEYLLLGEDLTENQILEVFKSLIQKAIQDEGMFVVNPMGTFDDFDKLVYNHSKQRLEQWQSAESKTVKKLLLIEKI